LLILGSISCIQKVINRSYIVCIFSVYDSRWIETILCTLYSINHCLSDIIFGSASLNTKRLRNRIICVKLLQLCFCSWVGGCWPSLLWLWCWCLLSLLCQLCPYSNE